MNKKIGIIFLVGFFIICFDLKAQDSLKPFPKLITSTVDNKKIVLPDDVIDKFTLLALAYSKKAEKDLTSWFSPIYNKFIKKPEGLFASFAYDINVFIVPMLSGLNAVASKKLIKKVSEEVDPLLIPHILFYKGDLNSSKQAISFSTKDEAYILLLDNKGDILHITTGAFSDNKITAIENYLDDL